MADPVKKWDKARPFVRINSPSENGGPGSKGATRLSGEGHDLGTRRQDDFTPQNSLLDALVISKLIALTPSWAKTEIDKVDQVGDSVQARELRAEQEVFGPLKRSFQTWTDAPPLPWHTWYDWNFHVEPEPPFAHLRGAGNEDKQKQADPIEANLPVPIGRGGPDPTAQQKRQLAKQEALVQGKTMELEWDCGAMGSVPGPMFERDLAWPMTDWFVWAVGRSIYDGGHEAEAEAGESAEEIKAQIGGTGTSQDQPKPAKKPEGKKVTVTRSELHPCKAVATARWEAHQFPGTDHFVPAIQFMFFANRRGGYKSFASLKPKDKDYEFIVDLPPPSGAFLPMEVPVGSTPDFPFNRLVLRQEPLVDFEFDAFLRINDPPTIVNVTRLPKELDPEMKLPSLEQMQEFAPKVELLPEGDNPRERQAKVTIPLTAFAAKNPDLDSYGVIVSIGWFDPDKQQGKDVKKCTVKFKKVLKSTLDHDTFSEEWRLKVGVNGRWFHHQFDGMDSNESRDLDNEVVLHLHKDDLISISAHGAELDLVDDVYAKEGRNIRISQREVNNVDLVEGAAASGDDTPLDVNWDTQIDGHRRANGTPLPDSSPTQRAICRKLFDLMFTTFNDQNDPLGIIDPNRGTVAENQKNPRKVSDVLKEKGEGNEDEIELVATATAEVGDSAELVRVHPDLADLPDDIDYRLQYSIKVETQDALKG